MKYEKRMVWKRKRRKFRKKFRRGGKRFRRRVRKAFRRYQKRKILVPRNTLAPAKCFITVRQVRTLAFISDADTTYDSIRVLGNGLSNTFPDLSFDAVDKKLFYYARLYNRYFCYASKIRVKMFQLYNNNTTLASFPVAALVAPTLSPTALTTSDYDYTPANFRPTFELAPRGRYKYFYGSQYGNGPKTIRNKCSTKKIYEKNVKTDDNFTGSFLTTDSVITLANPARLWYWQIIMLRPDLAVPGTYPVAEVNFQVVIDVEWKVMLYSTITTANVIDNE